METVLHGKKVYFRSYKIFKKLFEDLWDRKEGNI